MRLSFHVFTLKVSSLVPCHRSVSFHPSLFSFLVILCFSPLMFVLIPHLMLLLGMPSSSPSLGTSNEIYVPFVLPSYLVIIRYVHNAFTLVPINQTIIHVIQYIFIPGSPPFTSFSGLSSGHIPSASSRILGSSSTPPSTHPMLTRSKSAHHMPLMLQRALIP